MGARIGNWNPVFLDRAIGADQRGRANRPLDGLALGVFSRPPSAVGFHRFFLGIGQQCEWQVKLADKTVVRIDTIGADPHDDSIGF